MSIEISIFLSDKCISSFLPADDICQKNGPAGLFAKAPGRCLFRVPQKYGIASGVSTAVCRFSGCRRNNEPNVAQWRNDHTPASSRLCPRRLAACLFSDFRRRKDSSGTQRCNDHTPATSRIARGGSPLILSPTSAAEKIRAVPNGVTTTHQPRHALPAAARRITSEDPWRERGDSSRSASSAVPRSRW